MTLLQQTERVFDRNQEGGGIYSYFTFLSLLKLAIFFSLLLPGLMPEQTNAAFKHVQKSVI